MITDVDHSSRVHEFLLSPSAFPDKPKQVEMKETHISWIYLADRYVYKQKKPVRFEFLDFSTVQRRKSFCEQEVTLNRRLAPDVYLGVVPVSYESGNYHLNQPHNPVEWLVKMAKLDEASTLENLIETDGLTAAEIDHLSTQLTSFYSCQAPMMLRSDEFLTRLNQHVVSNRSDLLTALPSAEDTIEFVTSAQLRCLALESDYFVQRVADGRIVDGHGDLRPEHIYFRHAKPVIIDCIEFNAEYRTNDVIDDLAFLSMECDRLGNRAVGDSILNSYVDSGEDVPRPFLAAFYKCYRACVRAKVAALRAIQLSRNEYARCELLAQTYLNLAQKYAEELGSKVIVIVGGLSGSGKSTFAAKLRESLNAEMLQTDVIRKELYAANANSRNGKYSAEGRQRVYDEMVLRISSALQRSPTVILDGTFSKKANREVVFKKAKDCGAKILQVQCECPIEESRKRIALRLADGDSPSEATPELILSQLADYESIDDTQPLAIVDTSLKEPEIFDGLLEELRSLIRIK